MEKNNVQISQLLAVRELDERCAECSYSQGDVVGYGGFLIRVCAYFPHPRYVGEIKDCPIGKVCVKKE